MRLYNTRQWKRLREAQLERCPLCNFCAREGRVVAAQVVDHIQPHRGIERTFFDPTNLQSLCKSCHDSTKQQIETKGYANNIGSDGWPLDSNHPVNRHT